MDLEERIMELSRYGYACGQILGILGMLVSIFRFNVSATAECF